MVRKVVSGNELGADPVIKVKLSNDFGEDIAVEGTLVGEEMFFDDDTGMLTMEKLYQTSENSVAYSIISAVGHARERRAYTIEDRDEDTCRVNNGAISLDLSIDDLCVLMALAIESEQEVNLNAVSEQIRRKMAANE